MFSTYLVVNLYSHVHDHIYATSTKLDALHLDHTMTQVYEPAVSLTQV